MDVLHGDEVLAFEIAEVVDLDDVRVFEMHTKARLFDEPQLAAKAICDELRQNRYVLSYVPSSAPFGQPRSLLVVGNEGITVRAKSMQQPN
jgi:hypothetical protein